MNGEMVTISVCGLGTHLNQILLEFVPLTQSSKCTFSQDITWLMYDGSDLTTLT